MPRLFVALDLPPDRARELSTLRNDTLNARWTPAHQLHLTLRFLGQVDGAAESALREKLRGVRMAPFSLSGDGVEALPSRRRARVIVARIDAEPRLTALQAEIEHEVVDRSIEADTKRFFPHVTLARLKQAAPREVRRFLIAHADAGIEAFRVTQFHLYRSDLSPSGATYTVIESYDLEAEP
jgi:2'-5' RNA ligase